MGGGRGSHRSRCATPAASSSTQISRRSIATAFTSVCAPSPLKRSDALRGINQGSAQRFLSRIMSRQRRGRRGAWSDATSSSRKSSIPSASATGRSVACLRPTARRRLTPRAARWPAPPRGAGCPAGASRGNNTPPGTSEFVLFPNGFGRVCGRAVPAGVLQERLEGLVADVLPDQPVHVVAPALRGRAGPL